MMGQVAIAIAFPGLNDLDLGRSVTLILLFSWIISVNVSTELLPKFIEKIKKICQLESRMFCIFGKMHHRIRFQELFVYLCDGFKFLLKGYVCKKLVIFGIVYATDPLLQNMIKIVCLR